MINTPVVFLIFNRYETASEVFEQIRKAKPRKLFVVADGPRASKPGEKALVDKTRSIIDGVDWECELYTNFSDVNLGCDKRVVSGINWAFEYVDRAIILEDDCCPTMQFFEFCQEMLNRYECDKRIAYISGSVSIKGFKCQHDYFYSYFGDTWGWATWKDRWNRFEYGTEEFERKKQNYMKGVFSEKYRLSWIRDVERHFEKQSFPWDYIWLIDTSEQLKIVPSVNLTRNIGFSADSTHTFEKPKEYYGELGEISSEYTHPEEIEHNGKYARLYERRATYHLWDKVKGKMQHYRDKK